MYTRNAPPRLRHLPKRRAWPSRFITLRLDVRPRNDSADAWKSLPAVAWKLMSAVGWKSFP